MNIAISQIKMVRISDIPRLDPIRVTLEDIEPNKGRITFESYGQAWSAYWGGMSDRDIAQFFIDMSPHYLINNLAPNLSEKTFDTDALIEKANEVGLKKLKKNKNSDWGDYKQLDAIVNDLEKCSSPEDCWIYESAMETLFGQEWWRQIDEIAGVPNPQYVHLSRLVEAVKDGLRAMKEQELELEQPAVRRSTPKA